MLGDDGSNPGIVLIAQNDDMVADLIAAIVTNAGYAPLMAHDGLSALELARERRPALLITDLKLPELDGAGLLAALRTERAAGLRTILVTSSPRSRAKPSDADAVLPMPFHITSLEALLGRLISL